MPILFEKYFYSIFAIFYPSGEPGVGRIELTASALLQSIRSEIPRLHTLCRASAAISTHE